MNDYNIARATRGLAQYVRDWHRREGKPGRPAIAISHDTRFFSREFAELAAKVMTDLGRDALLFEGPRSTPELSFAVRYKNAAAGINITASHNPPGYNGYKVYFDDGGQVVAPHDQGIIDRVNAGDDSYEALPESERGKVIPIGREVDEAYMERLEKLIVDPELFHRKPALKTVFTPLHGVGGVIIVPMLHRLGVECFPVQAQMVPDGSSRPSSRPIPSIPRLSRSGWNWPTERRPTLFRQPIPTMTAWEWPHATSPESWSCSPATRSVHSWSGIASSASSRRAS